MTPTRPETTREPRPDDDALAALVRDSPRTGPCRRSGSTSRPGATASRPRHRAGGGAGCARLGRAAVGGRDRGDGRRRVRRGLAECPRLDRGGRSPGQSVAEPECLGAQAPARPVRRIDPARASSLNGEPAGSGQVLVRPAGDYRLADLATGTLGAAASRLSHSGPTTVVARPGGGWFVHLCRLGGTVELRSPRSTMTARSSRRPATGQTGTPTPSATSTGTLTRTVRGGQPTARRRAASTFSPDGRFAFLGWAAREGADGWNARHRRHRCGRRSRSIERAAGSSPSATADGGRRRRGSLPSRPRPSGGASSSRTSGSSMIRSSDAAVGRRTTGRRSFDGGTTVGPASAPAGSIAGDDLRARREGAPIDASTTAVLCSTRPGSLRFDRSASTAPASTFDGRSRRPTVWPTA